MLENIMMSDLVVWEPGMEIAVNQPYVVGALTLYIEKLAGDVRKGVDDQGTPWESILPAHYGHIVDTVGGDGEELDIYLKDNDCDWSADVYVIDQINLKTGQWDEHKIMMGFASAQEAEDTYIKAFSDNKGTDRLAAITTLDNDVFISWVYSGETTTAIASQVLPDMVVRLKAGLSGNTPTVVPVLTDAPARFGAVPITLHPVPTVTLIDTSAGETQRYDVYIVGYITSDPKDRTVHNDIVRLLYTLSEQAVINFYISSCGGVLCEATRLASAMRMSRAQVYTHAIGPVCSAAVCIWAEGHTRTISPYAYFMQHMSTHDHYGKSTDIARRGMVFVHYVRNVVLQRQLDIGLWTEQEVSNLVDKSVDLYITADQALLRMEA